MPDYDRGFKIVARAAAPQLAKLAGLECDQLQALGGELQATERLADRVFRARSGRDRFVIYMEAYTRWQATAPWSVLAKSGLLSERERLPTVSLIYILLPRGYQSQGGQFHLAVGSHPTQQIWFHEICLWQTEPEPWWEQSPGLMALYPLCHHSHSERDAVRHAAQAITHQATDSIVRADLLTTLCFFGKLAYPEINMMDLVGRQLMRESKFFEEIAAEERRDSVRVALEVRFGAEAASEFAASLAHITDLDRLSELHRLAIKCRRVGEFRKALAAQSVS